MSQASQLQPFYEFLHISRNLVELAKEGQWDNFQEILNTRQQLVATLESQAFLDQVAAAGLADEARLLIAEIQSINDQLATTAEAVRDELAKEIRQNIQGSKAIDAYGR